MRPRLHSVRLWFSLLFVFAASAAQAQSAPPDLDARTREALHEAAASPSLQPWQHDFMLRLSGGRARSSAGDTTRNDQPPQDTVRSAPSPRASAVPQGTWTVIPPVPFNSPPGVRLSATGVYDSARRRMVVFGGSYSALLNDVWTLKLDYPFTWTQLFPTGSPPEPRRLHAAVYDATRDRMIVFGGIGASTFLNDAWALQFTGPTGASWTLLTPLGAPPAARADFAMIHDPVGDRVLVFGGFDGVSPPSLRRSDLWQLSLAGTPQWTQLAPGAGPSARSGHRAAYDPVRKRMIVFGGYDVTFLNDTWALSLDGPLAWTSLAPLGSRPGVRVEHTVIYDPIGDRLVIYGGYDDPNNTHLLADAWALPLGPLAPWTLVLGGGEQIWGHVAIMDPVRREMLVFGGFDYDLGYSNYSFTLDLFGTPQWLEHPPAGATPLTTPSAVYDPARKRMVVFGGARSEFSNDVWVLNLGASPSWFQMFPTGTLPPPRRLHGAAYDQPGDRMIVFGGFDGTNRNDAWSLQFAGATDAAWTQILPAGPLPPGRSDFAMVLDPVARRLVVFGGYDGVSPPAGRRGDLWTLDLNGPPAWTQLILPGAPTARSGQRGIYDPVRNRMVVFGGYDVAMLNDVWQLTLGASPAWGSILPAGPLPLPRADHALAYDSVRDRLVLHAGYDGFSDFGDTWVLPFAGAPAWQEITPVVGPGPRWGVAGIYDPPYDRLVVFGGSNYSPVAFALTWDMPTPTLLALQSVDARPGLVHLVWMGSVSSGVHATVYRREGGTDWRALGVADPDGSGRIVWEDRDVAAGVRYEYRLGVLENGRETYLGATSAIVPSGIELSVHAISSRFAAGRLALWCSVPAPGPARLEVIDVAGRRIAQRELEWPAAGAMEVSIAPAPASGLYFARLSQAGRSVRTRVSVIH
jgi:galactose oxidase-like protein